VWHAPEAMLLSLACRVGVHQSCGPEEGLTRSGVELCRMGEVDLAGYPLTWPAFVCSADRRGGYVYLGGPLGGGELGAAWLAWRL